MLDNSLLSAFSDMEEGLVARQKLANQLKAQEDLVKALKVYDRLAWLQYEGGYTPYLMVLTAETQLFPAELTASQVRTGLLAAFVNIYKAMGDGWLSRADELTQARPAPTR